MKLLSKAEAQSKVKRENAAISEENARLRKEYRELIAKLSSAKSNYDPEKIKALEVFESFSKIVTSKREKMLREMAALDKEITARKELYYGLIEKQDELQDRDHTIKEKETTLELREQFVNGLEKRTYV